MGGKRERPHQRSDVYDEYSSRHRDDSNDGHHQPHDGRDRNKKPRDMDERGSAGDRRPKQNRQRDMTTASPEEPDYRDHSREGPSRL